MLQIQGVQFYMVYSINFIPPIMASVYIYTVVCALSGQNCYFKQWMDNTVLPKNRTQTTLDIQSSTICDVLILYKYLYSPCQQKTLLIRTMGPSKTVIHFLMNNQRNKRWTTRNTLQ